MKFNTVKNDMMIARRTMRPRLSLFNRPDYAPETRALARAAAIEVLG